MKIDTEILCSFIDGQLDEQTANAIRAALETDPKLRHEYQTLQKTAQLVRSLPRVSAPPDLAATITAHAERAQLFGLSEPGQSRPSRLRWMLSMAASLLIGATLGTLGYHSLCGPVAPARPAAGPIVTRAPDDFESDASSTRALDDRTVMGGALDRAGEELVTGLPVRPSKTDYVGKGGSSIARTGPLTGAPAKSHAGDFGRAADAIVTNGRFAEAEQAQELAGALKAPRKEAAQVVERGATEVLALAGDVPKSRAKSAETSDEALRTGVTVQKALAGRKNIPLERQVRVSNILNQDMAANLQFEAEPLNVKVVSKDSAKTLQFVQRWALANSLIDLNEAPAKVNFPAFAQVVYQGQPGKNTRAETKNSIFVRTTRRQAQDIVGQLQRQKPTVLSVSVKDDKKLLGDLALQPGQQQTAYLAGTRELGEKDADKKADLQIRTQPAGVAYRRRLRTPANGYLYDLSNQAQVFSLEDLVTLVVLVEDAPPAVKTKLDSPTIPAATESNSPESQSKPK